MIKKLSYTNFFYNKLTKTLVNVIANKRVVL